MGIDPDDTVMRAYLEIVDDDRIVFGTSQMVRPGTQWHPMVSIIPGLETKLYDFHDLLRYQETLFGTMKMIEKAFGSS